MTEAERNAIIEQCAGVAAGAADLLAWRWKIKTSEGVDLDPHVGARIDEACRIAADIRALASDPVKANDDLNRPNNRGELPDDLREPLHSLQADTKYLIARVVEDGSVAGMMTDSILQRLSHIEEAAYRLNGLRCARVKAADAWLDEMVQPGSTGAKP